MMRGLGDGVDPGWGHYSGFWGRSHVGDGYALSKTRELAAKLSVLRGFFAARRCLLNSGLDGKHCFVLPDEHARLRCQRSLLHSALCPTEQR